MTLVSPLSAEGFGGAKYDGRTIVGRKATKFEVKFQKRRVKDLGMKANFKSCQTAYEGYNSGKS